MNVVLVIVLGIVSLVLGFLWSWLILWVGAKIIGSKEGSWRNCAILTGIYFAVFGVFIGLCALAALLDSFFSVLLWLAAAIAVTWFLIRVTMNILDITFLNCVALIIVTWGLDWFASFVLGRLVGILPGV